MKLAVLGTDADVLRLVAAAASDGHEIIWLGDVRPADTAAIASLVPQLADRASDWELLLDHAVADAVLVGHGLAGSDKRAEQLKRLAAEAVPLLVVQPVTDSVLSYYELDMVRRETGGILRHYNPLAGHPDVAQFAGWVREGHPTIGSIHQLTCERHVSDASRISVLGHFARDIELLSAAAGQIRRVTAIGPSMADASFASLQVQMTSDGSASLRWSVGSLNADNDFEMRLVGERGTVALAVPADITGAASDAWRLETKAGGAADHRQLPPYNASLAAVRQLAAAVAEDDAERRARASTWEAATRAMEVVDAVELSLQKGRTIDVYQQKLTEQLAFRGTMAALGCGLLVLGLIVVVLVGLLGLFESPLQPEVLPSWPILLLAVLAFFLLLQVVPLMVSKKNRHVTPTDAERHWWSG